MAKERVTYLDMAKGVGILLVILGHEADLPLAARQFVTSFHMPLFFILSGMAVCLTGEKERPFSQILKRKSRSIMRPYFIFSVLCLIMEVFCAGVLKNVLWETVREHLWATVCLAGASVFWFLPALFFGELLFIGIFTRAAGLKNKGLQKSVQGNANPQTGKRRAGLCCGIIVTLLSVIAYWLHLQENVFYGRYGQLLWGNFLHLFLNAVLRVFFAMVFIAIGYAGYSLLRRLPKRRLADFCLGAVLMAATWQISQKNGITDMNYMVFGNIFLYAMTSVGGSFGLILLCRAVEKSAESLPGRILQYYGRNSLVVMMTHAPFYVMYVATVAMYIINNHILPLNSLLLCGGIVVGVLMIEVPIIEVLNRYFPFLLGKEKRKE